MAAERNRDEETQQLIDMGIKCLLAAGALFLSFAAGVLSMMRSASSNCCGRSPGLFDDSPPTLGGYSACSTMLCGICGSNIAQGATICPFCQRKPDCRL